MGIHHEKVLWFSNLLNQSAVNICRECKNITHNIRGVTIFEDFISIQL